MFSTEQRIASWEKGNSLGEFDAKTVEEWTSLRNLINNARATIEDDSNLSAKLTSRKLAHAAHDSLPSQPIRDWFNSHPDAAQFKKDFKKLFCDTEGEKRQALFASMEQNENAAPSPIPGLSSEKIKEAQIKRHQVLAELEEQKRKVAADPVLYKKVIKVLKAVDPSRAIDLEKANSK